MGRTASLFNQLESVFLPTVFTCKNVTGNESSIHNWPFKNEVTGKKVTLTVSVSGFLSTTVSGCSLLLLQLKTMHNTAMQKRFFFMLQN